MGTVVQFPRNRVVNEAPISKARLCMEIGRSKRWIEYAMKDGMPYWRKENGHTRFRLSEVLAWLDETRSA